jgi:hypothetical protein
VDTTKPEMGFKKVSVTGSGLNGPLVEIEWEAKDKNLTPEPVVLEYSEDQKTWKTIAAKTANTGRYTWEIADKKLWKFWVRGSASDMAGNTTLGTYNNEAGTPVPVLVDLDKPSGNVDKVNPNGNPTTPPGTKGIGYEPPPGTSGGGVTGIAPTPPGPLNITPVGSGDKPKPTNPPPPVTPPPVSGPITPPPQPPVQGPPIPELPPKKDEPKKDEPKKPDEKKIELPPIGGEPVNLPIPPIDTPPVAPLPIPPINK